MWSTPHQVGGVLNRVAAYGKSTMNVTSISFNGRAFMDERADLPQELKRKIVPGLHTMVAEHRPFLGGAGDVGASALTGERIMRAVVIKDEIPAQLKSKISPTMLLFSGVSGLCLRLICIAVAAFVLYAGALYNGFRYLLGACISCFSVIIVYRYFPLRPYRGAFYNKSMRDIDTSDPVVTRLLELYRSKDAYRHLSYQAVRLFVLLFALAWGTAVIAGHRVSWLLSFSSARFWWFTVLSFVICLGVLGNDLSHWGVVTWARRETQRSSSNHLN